jgi:transposase
MSKHFGAQIIGRVLEMKEQGMTNRIIAEKFGFTAIQIKRLVTRHNRRSRSPAGVAKRRGRPKTNPIPDEHKYLERIRQLEMEVELYRSFLHAAGRR